MVRPGRVPQSCNSSISSTISAAKYLAANTENEQYSKHTNNKHINSEDTITRSNKNY